MTEENVEYVHTSYLDILRTRGMQGLQKNMQKNIGRIFVMDIQLKAMNK